MTAEESQNFYHFHDNRVLPSHVDADLAAKEGAAVLSIRVTNARACWHLLTGCAGRLTPC